MAAQQSWREVPAATTPVEPDAVFAELLAALRTRGATLRLFQGAPDEVAVLVRAKLLLSTAREMEIPADLTSRQERALLFSAAGAERADELLELLAAEVPPAGEVPEPLVWTASPPALHPLDPAPGIRESPGAIPRVTEKIGEGPEHLRKRSDWFQKRSGPV